MTSTRCGATTYGRWMDDWWLAPFRDVFDGRRVVLAGDVAAAWTEHIALLRSVGATDLMVVATTGRGVGALPDLPTVFVEPPDGLSFLERIHFGTDVLEHPPDHVLAALDRFDPTGEALVIGTFLNTATELGGRPFLASRRPEWVELEDKVVIDAFWDRADIERSPSVVVDLADAWSAGEQVNLGDGTVWAADARDGFTGGGSGIRWVTDAGTRDRALADLGPICDRVRVMPFLDGIPCSIHGIVLPDGVVALRPVELITLRRGNDFVYAGCATFWDPPDAVREQMRTIARRVGRQLEAEVEFRGTFTVDGVVTDAGFRPTELNPRFGAGIMTIARAAGLPIVLMNDLIVAGHDLDSTAADIEAQLVDAADRHRGGGTWISGVAGAPSLAGDQLVIHEGEFHRVMPGDTPAATVIGGGGFVRCRYQPDAVPIGPSTGPLAAAFWRFADRELGTAVGPLTSAPDRS